MPQRPSRVVFFDLNMAPTWVPNATKGMPAINQGDEEWLQITAVENIGNIDGKDIHQKIIRLNSEQQLELYSMLHTKFGTRSRGPNAAKD